MAALPADSVKYSVDYDFSPIEELVVDETDYRVDPGFRGAVAISARTSGTWAWELLAEGQWDGVRLKAKAIDRAIVIALEKALRAAAETEQ